MSTKEVSEWYKSFKPSTVKRKVRMLEPVGTEQKDQAQIQSTASVATNQVTHTDPATPIKTFIGVCSCAIIACFFLPWIQFLFGTPSGYQLQQLPSDRAKLVWLIPVAGLLPLIALAAKQGVAAMAGIAGAAPFIALAYYVTQYGRDLLGALQIGAYLTFIFAALLCVLAIVLSKITH